MAEFPRLAQRRLKMIIHQPDQHLPLGDSFPGLHQHGLNLTVHPRADLMHAALHRGVVHDGVPEAEMPAATSVEGADPASAP